MTKRCEDYLTALLILPLSTMAVVLANNLSMGYLDRSSLYNTWTVYAFHTLVHFCVHIIFSHGAAEGILAQLCDYYHK
jgi:hypothetical protein